MTILLSSTLELHDVSHAYDKVKAVDRVSIHVNEGEVVCLLGPSGCGKSTVLRLAAGLETLQQGRISMRGATMAGGVAHQTVPPEHRGVGLVFQDFALFPHLSVARNVGFGLTELAAEAREKRIADVLDQVDMSDYAQAFPHTLSGGQQQRIALARALAPHPSVLLLDEPFSGLDARLREQIRDETLHVLKRSKAATMMVTHDPEEAMFMADRIYLMQSGRVVQSGSPDVLYHRPVTPFVARFFSNTNELMGRVCGGAVMTPFGNLPAPGISEGEEAQILVRPESLQWVLPGNLSQFTASGQVEQVRFLGGSKLLVVRLESGSGLEVSVQVRHVGRRLPETGSRIVLQVDPTDALIFPRRSEDARNDLVVAQ